MSSVVAIIHAPLQKNPTENREKSIRFKPTKIPCKKVQNKKKSILSYKLIHAPGGMIQNGHQSPIRSNHSKLSNSITFVHLAPNSFTPLNVITCAKRPVVRASNSSEQEDEATMTERQSFLSIEEAGLVEISGLNTHERFLCRLTISSLNLLKVIAEQEDCSIEELNAGRVCDWFLKDKLKREQNIGSAVLQWDNDDPFEDFI